MDGPRVAAGVTLAREPPFELTFRLEAQDYHALLKNLRWHAVERAVALLPASGIAAAGALIGVFALLTLGDAKSESQSWNLAAPITGAVILYVLYRLVVMPRYRRSLFTGQPMALGDTKVVADARGIGSNIAEIVIAMPWSSVIRIVETDQHIFLLFARLAGVIVPKRAFVSGDQARRFTAFVRGMAPAPRRG
jgi:hypothetical protein